MRFVLDVNIWISFAIGKSQSVSQIYEILLQDDFEIIFCHQLMKELIASLQKPKLQKYLNPERVNRILQLLESTAIVIYPTSIISACRDEKDNYLLALAKDGQAEYLITGDKDLLVLNPFESIQILTLSEFLEQSHLSQ